MSQQLIADWLAGTLATQDEEKFVASLRNNVELQRELLRESHLQSALRQAVRDRITRGELGLQDSELTIRRNVPRRHTRGSRPMSASTLTRWSLAAAALLVVVVGGVMLTPKNNSPVLETTAGTITVDGQVSNGHVRLVAGERIGVTSGTAKMRLSDGSVVEMSAGTTVVIGNGEERILSLETGTISAAVKPQQGDHRFIIQTPHFDTRVVGTAYILKVFPDRTRLTVTEGVVAVGMNEEKEQLIHAGEKFTRSDVVLGWRFHGNGDNVVQLLADKDLLHDGRPTLAVAYDPPDVAIGWDLIQRPFKIGLRTTVRIWIQLESAEKQASINVIAVEKDGDSWMLLNRRLDNLPLQTWVPLDVPLRKPLKNVWKAGDGEYKPEQVRFIRIAPTIGASRFHVDLAP